MTRRPIEQPKERRPTSTAPTTAEGRRARRWPAFAIALTLAACQTAAPPQATRWLSITAPADGQTLSGTVIAAAVGVGGEPTDLTFYLAGLAYPADTDGLAPIDTRTLPDGPATLEATATIAGTDVTRQIAVVIDNDVPASATVGAAGGTLRSPAGSFVTIPAGALSTPATVTLVDTTQQEILDDFGIDYPALGVTFLGALTVESDVERFDRPAGVDLAGWAQAVQPNQQVVMFSVAPDSDGDGIGELTFAANALATPDGSVVTVPVPPSEIYGPPGATTTTTRLQAVNTRPGQIVRLAGRGYNAVAPLSNVARFPGGEDLLAIATVTGADRFNPLMEVRVAVPALGAGTHLVTFNNLTTGYASDAVPLAIGTPLSGSAAQYAAFVDQVEAALTALTADRPDVQSAAQAWLATLAASTSPTARAMVAASALVSTTHAATLTGMDPTAVTSTERDLLHDHALVLDAIAASEPGLAPSAADLATLLVMLTPEPLAAGTTRTSAARRLQGTGGSCTSSASGISFTAGTPTGMGSAGSAACQGGSTTAPTPAPGTTRLATPDAATTSHREGSLGPLSGAFVALFRQGTDERLTPFTAVTDRSGYYFLPFVPPGEPYTLRAIHPETGTTATYDGTSGDLDQLTAVQLLFTPDPTIGTIDARFTITPLTRPGHYRFDNGPYTDPTANGDYQWSWTIGDADPLLTDTPTLDHQFRLGGSYAVQLSIVDTLTLEAGASSPATIDVTLPYPYVAGPATRITETALGAPGDVGVEWGYDLSADGRRIVFASAASNLVPNDTNGRIDVFLHDRILGTTERISLAGDGTQLTTDSSQPTISDDGSHVAYVRGTSIVVLDLATRTEQVVAPQAGLAAAIEPSLSADGRTLAFRSFSFNFGSHRSQVHVVDLDTTTVTLVSEGFANEDAPNEPQISADGRYVAFDARERDSGGVVLGNRVYRRDLDTATTVRVSETEGGVGADGAGPAISADGGLVAFQTTSTAYLSPDANGTEMDIFVRDMTSGTLSLVHRSAEGVQGTIDAYGPSLSGDGRWVVFGGYSANLVPVGLDFCGSLYWCGTDYVPGYSFVVDRDTGWVAILTVAADGTSPDEFDQTDPVISADGRTVIFQSYSSNMVDGATNDEFQLYWVENPLWEP